jgi:hypothetical protein
MPKPANVIEPADSPYSRFLHEKSGEEHVAPQPQKGKSDKSKSDSVPRLAPAPKASSGTLSAFIV